MKNKRWIIQWSVVCCALLLQSCSLLDNYLLGKDNTPKPGALPALQSSSLTLKEQWSISIGKSSHDGAAKRLPLVRDHIVYVADAHGRVLALNESNGNINWSVQLSDTISSGPTVHQGLLALGTAFGVTVLDQADGHLVWRARTSGEVLAKPLFMDSHLIVKTMDGQLIAFDVKTGKKQWKMEHGTPSLVLKVSSSPVKMGRAILVGFSDGKLDAVDADTGRVLWQRSIAYASGASDVERLVDIDADPIVRDDVVYIATYQGYMGAMSLSNGQFIWNKPASTYKNLAIDGQHVYMTDSDDTVLALSRTHGQVLWKQPGLVARGLTAPAIMGSYIILGDKTGLLHVLSAEQGHLMARVPLKGGIDVAPVISGHRVYVLTTTGQLTCFTVGE